MSDGQNKMETLLLFNHNKSRAPDVILDTSKLDDTVCSDSKCILSACVPVDDYHFMHGVCRWIHYVAVCSIMRN